MSRTGYGSLVRGPCRDLPSTMATRRIGGKQAAGDVSLQGGGCGVSAAQQLDDIALYWFTGTEASTARRYWEALRCGCDQEAAIPRQLPRATL